DVVARAHQLGVDRILDVAAAVALEHLALPGDEDHLLRADLLEAERPGLHPDAAALPGACRHVAPDEVPLVLEAENAAPERNLFAELTAHRREHREGRREPALW